MGPLAMIRSRWLGRACPVGLGRIPGIAGGRARSASGRPHPHPRDGTGWGPAAFDLADRYPDGEVVGIDVYTEIVVQAKPKAKVADPGGRMRFLVADIADLITTQNVGYDLIVMLNMPPFFEAWWPS